MLLCRLAWLLERSRACWRTPSTRLAHPRPPRTALHTPEGMHSVALAVPGVQRCCLVWGGFWSNPEHAGERQIPPPARTRLQ
eukprot:9958960-Alexandrium_andersonii.AAC.1